MRLLTPLISLLLASSALAADGLPERLSRLGVTATALFHAPASPLEERLFQTGLLHFWQQYGGPEEPRREDFKGYVLFGNAFHTGLKRISFLLGADCSGFVQRVLQLMGAEYPYGKTRHLIHVVEAARSGLTAGEYYRQTAERGKPVDLSPCRWRELTDKFALVAADAEGQPGDLVVFPKAENDRGVHGHVALLTGPHAILHAKGRAPGITEEALDPALSFSRLRWRAPLAPLRGETLPDIMAASFDEDPSRCR